MSPDRQSDPARDAICGVTLRVCFAASEVMSALLAPSKLMQERSEDGLAAYGVSHRVQDREVA